VARLLVQTGASRPSGATRRTIRDMLTQLAADDFAVVRAAPPLVFNNDMTASVKRFYWSVDAGYALWLRLDAVLAQ
jgi:hypothetical protein